MHLSSDAMSLWAKLGKAEYPVLFHPLLFHLIDVALVGRHLWNDVLRAPAKERFARAIGLSTEQCDVWVPFWIGAHDIGKACPSFAFQGNTTILRKALTSSGFADQTQKKPHGTVSTTILKAWLQDRGFPSKIAQNVAVSVGGHHGVFPSVAAWKKLAGTSVLGGSLWADCRNQILHVLADLLGVPPTTAMIPCAGSDDHWLILLAGLTTAADWIGSNQNFFPFASNATDYLDSSEQRIRSYFNATDRRAAGALAALGWIRGNPGDRQQRSFRDVFAYLNLPGLRPLQEETETAAKSIDGPSLVLIEAPMGEGKTEAALYLAEQWERHAGQGLYVALPTMATSNGMFPRVIEFLKHSFPNERMNLHLLHSKSLLHPAYTALRRASGTPPFEQIYDEGESDSERPDVGAVVADAWFSQDKRQALLAPAGVGSIDQILLSVLQTKHYFVRLFGLTGKAVILDEVHAYDVYMTTLMERLLEWLSALGCHVVLLSATLPKERRLRLLAAFAGRPVELAPQPIYPFLAIVPANEASATVRSISVTSQKTIYLEWKPDDALLLALSLDIALANGGCAAVICNSVARAQQMYQCLRSQLSACGCEVELFHARFLFGRRQAIEENVLGRYGKSGDRPARSVLVATQVIEQSLDLDFDLLVTELAPIDLLLQRAGRLWRHHREKRPLSQPTVWLLQPVLSEDGVPDLRASVYSEYVRLRTFLAIKDRPTIEIPADIEELIEAVYGVDESCPAPSPQWQDSLAAALDDLKREQDASESLARSVYIPSPKPDANILHSFNAQLSEEEDPRTAEAFHAQTRESDPSVPLVIVYDIDGRVTLDPQGEVPIDLTTSPSLEETKALLGNSISISHWGCWKHYSTQDPPSSWRKSGLLRFYRVVHVDRDGQSLDGEYPLTVDNEIGVLIGNAIR